MAIQYRNEQIEILSFAVDFMAEKLKAFRAIDFTFGKEDFTFHPLLKTMATEEKLLESAKTWTHQISQGTLCAVNQQGQLRVEKVSDQENDVVRHTSLFSFTILFSLNGHFADPD